VGKERQGASAGWTEGGGREGEGWDDGAGEEYRSNGAPPPPPPPPRLCLCDLGGAEAADEAVVVERDAAEGEVADEELRGRGIARVEGRDAQEQAQADAPGYASGRCTRGLAATEAAFRRSSRGDYGSKQGGWSMGHETWRMEDGASRIKEGAKSMKHGAWSEEH
jgi:hypothetical protein